jgi:hypothetical protein
MDFVLRHTHTHILFLFQSMFLRLVDVLNLVLMDARFLCFYPRFSFYLLTHALTHSLTHSRIHSLTHSGTHSFTHSRTPSLIHALTHSHTHSLTYLLTHFSHAFIQPYLSQNSLPPVIHFLRFHSPTHTYTYTHTYTHTHTFNTY